MAGITISSCAIALASGGFWLRRGLSSSGQSLPPLPVGPPASVPSSPTISLITPPSSASAVANLPNSAVNKPLPSQLSKLKRPDRNGGNDGDAN